MDDEVGARRSRYDELFDQVGYLDSRIMEIALTQSEINAQVDKTFRQIKVTIDAIAAELELIKEAIRELTV